MSKRSSQRPGLLHRVALLVDENSNPFEVGCACEVFGISRPELDRELYELQIVSPTRRTRMREGMFSLVTNGTLRDLADADTVIVPNRPDVNTAHRASVLSAVRHAHERGARLVGLCTGAFTLAEAGLLDGRPATVHWQLAEEFRRRFPSVALTEDVLFVDDGDVLTSAGSAAALDLALHIVRRDHGAHVANLVSRRLVFSAFRDGGQKQFVERPVPQPDDGSLAPVLAWAQARLDEPLTVHLLARRASVSPATLHRRFQTEVGTTPLAWLTAERVDLACRLLERGGLGMDEVARRAGLGTAANLRTRVRARTGLSPSDYGRRFAAVRA